MPQFKTQYGIIQTPDWSDDLIATSLEKHGEWAFIESLVFSTLIRKGDKVWDGGAFLGTFGLGATQIAAQAGRRAAFLLAIEPGTELNASLQCNLQRNSPCLWDLAARAISLHETTMQAVFEAEANHGARAYHVVPDTADAAPDPDASGADPAKASADGTQVQGWPLWHLRQQYGDYDCLKLDLEGMEFEALKSDFDYIHDKKPVIWVECNESPHSLKVLEAMCALGYDPIYVASLAFRPDNFNRNPYQIYPMAYEAALVGVPRDRLAGFDPAAAAPDHDIILRHVRNSWDLRNALWVTPRWAMAEWINMSRSELIALMGRILRDESLETFLFSDDVSAK